MTLNDLAAVASLVSSLAVLASLALLARQIRQSERQTRAAMETPTSLPDPQRTVDRHPSSGFDQSAALFQPWRRVKLKRRSWPGALAPRLPCERRTEHRRSLFLHEGPCPVPSIRARRP
jgi:hypothetical protein